MLDSVASGRVEDAIICPVSTQYDKVIEVEYVIQFSSAFPNAILTGIVPTLANSSANLNLKKT
jgi:hypothetical protein